MLLEIYFTSWHLRAAITLLHSFFFIQKKVRWWKNKLGRPKPKKVAFSHPFENKWQILMHNSTSRWNKQPHGNVTQNPIPRSALSKKKWFRKNKGRLKIKNKSQSNKRGRRYLKRSRQKTASASTPQHQEDGGCHAFLTQGNSRWPIHSILERLLHQFASFRVVSRFPSVINQRSSLFEPRIPSLDLISKSPNPDEMTMTLQRRLQRQAWPAQRTLSTPCVYTWPSESNQAIWLVWQIYTNLKIRREQ